MPVHPAARFGLLVGTVFFGWMLGMGVWLAGVILAIAVDVFLSLAFSVRHPPFGGWFWSDTGMMTCVFGTWAVSAVTVLVFTVFRRE